MREVGHARKTLMAVGAGAMLFGCGGGRGTLLVKNENRSPVTVWIYQPDTRPGAGSDAYTWASAGTIPSGGEHEYTSEIANLGDKGKLRIQPGAGPIQGVAVDTGSFSGSGCGGERKSSLTIKSNETLDFGPGTKSAVP